MVLKVFLWFCKQCIFSENDKQMNPYLEVGLSLPDVGFGLGIPLVDDLGAPFFVTLLLGVGVGLLGAGLGVSLEGVLGNGDFAGEALGLGVSLPSFVFSSNFTLN